MYTALIPLTIAMFVLEGLSKGGGGSEESPSGSGIGNAIGEALSNNGHPTRKEIIASEWLKDGCLIFAYPQLL